jgi:hypothetical protein
VLDTPVIKRADQARIGYVTDLQQDAQFTAEAIMRMLNAHGVPSSMGGNYDCVDNVFVELISHRITLDGVVLRANDGLKGDAALTLDFASSHRAHRALDRSMPDAVYFEAPGLRQIA